MKSKGFTFIELILVAMIIIVLAGLATPLFRTPFRGIQLRNTSQDLVQLMRYIQAKAISERKLCRINFDFDEGSFWPTEQENAHPGRFKRLKGKWGRKYKVPESVSIDSEALFINFYPDGGTDKTKVKLSDSKGKTLTITTQKNIGYVKVEMEE